MARPKAKELTERELEIMQVFWDHGEQTPQDVRDRLAEAGRDLAYTTVATLVRILLEKGFVRQTCDERPFRYEPARSFEEVSGNLVKDMVRRVFRGSVTKLLVSLLEQAPLTTKERDILESIGDGSAMKGLQGRLDEEPLTQSERELLNCVLGKSTENLSDPKQLSQAERETLQRILDEQQ